MFCNCDNFVPVVVPGLSSDTNISGSACDSAANTQMLAPSDRDARPASRNRLQDLPEWYKEFTDNLVDTRSTFTGSDRTCRPDPTNQEGSTTHFHFLKDPHCEICKRTKIARAPCRRNPKSHMRQSSVTSSQAARRSSMKKENRETIRGMQSWCKIWPLNGFKVTHANRIHHKKRRETYESFLIQKKIQRKCTLTNHWDLLKIGMNLDGTILRPHLIGLR